VGSFRTRRRGPFGRNGAILRHFERDAIPYALETDWPVEAAGFEFPHFRIGIRHSNLALICGRFSRASQRDVAGVHLFTAFELAPRWKLAGLTLLAGDQRTTSNPRLCDSECSGSDSQMRRFESRRLG
jgi:hypothetical protein